MSTRIGHAVRGFGRLSCALLLACSALAQSPAMAGAAADGWKTATPAEAGFKPDVATQIDNAVKQGKLKNLHAVVVVRDGKLVFERYYQGTDERWTVPLGVVKFGPESKHDLRSTSKSMTGLLYGIALGEGKVAAPDQPLYKQLPDFPELASDPQKRKIKVEHVLSMTLGTEWHEDLPYTDPENSEVAMYRAPNAARFVLHYPVAAEPGTRWQYSGGATAVLGELIARGTKMPLEYYARDKLFAPLGIVDAEWIGGSNGVVAAASGVRLRARDLAKVGQMVLNGGRWGDKQVVPAAWLEQATKAHGHPPPMNDSGEFGYGYQWGLVRLKQNNQQWIFAPGNGGQRLMIVPGQKLVVVIFAGNYNLPDQDDVPDTVVGGILMPSLIEARAATSAR